MWLPLQLLRKFTLLSKASPERKLQTQIVPLILSTIQGGKQCYTWFFSKHRDGINTANFFYEANINQIPKPDKGIIHKT